jgi:hypothetical protein
LEHRQEQIKAEEIKLRSMQLNIERLEADMGKLQDEMRGVKEHNTQQAQKLEDASALLQVGVTGSSWLGVPVEHGKTAHHMDVVHPACQTANSGQWGVPGACVRWVSC